MTPTVKPQDVCLTFNLDALAVWVGTYGQRTPQYVSRGELAARTGVPRILDLLRREGVRATWFLPALDVLTYPDTCRRIRDEGHEIAHHGYAHEKVDELDAKAELGVLHRGLDVLDEVLDVRPRGYRAPGANSSSHTCALLDDLGFDWDSSLMGRDFELYHARRDDLLSTESPMVFGPQLRLVEVPISWTLNDFPFIEPVMVPPLILPGSIDLDALGRRWIDDLEFMTEEVPGGTFTQILHPGTIGRGGRIELLECLIRRGRELGLRFCTISESVATWRERAAS